MQHLSTELLFKTKLDSIHLCHHVQQMSKLSGDCTLLYDIFSAMTVIK